MSAQTISPVLEEVFQNMRQATEAGLKMQQEMLRHWTTAWPGMPSPQSAWIDHFKSLRQAMATAVSDTARRHREVVDRQYQAALESLDAALNTTSASTPEEFRRRAEQFCRKMLDCVRDSSEAQIKESQEMISRFTDLLTKTGP